MARTRSGKTQLLLAVMTIVVATVATWWWRSHEPKDMAPKAHASSGSQAEVPAPTPPADGQTQASLLQGNPPASPSAPTAPVQAATLLTAASPPSPGPASEPAIGSTGGAIASASPAGAAEALAAGNLVLARRLLNKAANPLAETPANEQIVQQLCKVADETLFSTKTLQNDPLVIKHVVEPRQNLQKIANLYKTTVPLICRVNNLASANTLRQGQPLKVVLGPFHATVCKHQFKMYLYCQDTLVKVLPVGLGADGKGTPTGRWKILNKVPNPRYYPPDGGPILEADDPKNPLGEHWIGLEGFEGNAVGQQSFGIHGTIEPETIGKNASKGCIRMHNEDVAFVYELLVRHDSIVTVVD